MIRAYMDVIYRLHDFFGKKDNTPIGDTVIVMCLVHFFQLATISLYLVLIFKFSFGRIPKSLLYYLVCGLIMLAYYFVVFYNGKWKKWAKQFKKETPEARRRNGIKVWLFCWGSIGFFFLSAPIFSLLKYGH
jgi:hypothetical protein